MDHSAGLRRHDAYGPRILRQRFLATGIEQTFGAELLLQLLEPHVEVSEAGLAHGLDDELVGAPLDVDVHTAEDGYLHVLLGLEIDPRAAAGEHGASYLAALVLQCEIVMARGGAGEIGDLAVHPYIVESWGRLKHPFDPCVQLGDCQRSLHDRGQAFPGIF